MYNKLKNQVKQDLYQAERVAITTDAWTSCATNSYVTIRAHHISLDWELRTHVLQTIVFNDSHTGRNIGALPKEACADWNILDKDPTRNWQCQKHDRSSTWSWKQASHFLLCAYIKSHITEGFASGHSCKVAWESKEGGWVFASQHWRCWNPQWETTTTVFAAHKLIQDVSTRWNSSLTCCSGSWSNSQLCFPLSSSGRSGKERRWTVLMSETFAMLKTLLNWWLQ